MKIHQNTIQVTSQNLHDIQDITDQVAQIITGSKIQTGLINILIKHTSAALFLNENEPGLIKDFQTKLEELSPVKKYYEHNQSHICKNEMCFNGHSHCNALFLPAELTLPIIAGQLNLGTWQRILFVELDRSRPRTLDIMIMGK